MALAEPVEQAVLAEVLLLVGGAITEIAEVRSALERAWAALREPTTLQDELQERQRQHLSREIERARTRLKKATTKFVDGDIDKEAYDLLREETQRDLHAATAELERISAVPKTIDLPPLEVVLSAMHDWRAAFRDGDIAAQRQVLSMLLERVKPLRTGLGKYTVEITWTPLGEALRAALSLQVHESVPAAA